MRNLELEPVVKTIKAIAREVISSPWIRGGLSSWMALGGAPLDAIRTYGSPAYITTDHPGYTLLSEQVISGNGVTVTRIRGDGDISDIGMLIAGQNYPNDSAFLDSAMLATNYLFEFEPFQSRQQKFSVYALASQSTPYLKCIKEQAFACGGGELVSMINNVNNALGIPMQETFILVNVPDISAAAGRDVKNPPNIYTGAMLTEGSLRWEWGRISIAHEWGGHPILNLGEEYFTPDQPADLYINCVTNPEVSWQGIPSAPGRQYEGCGNSDKNVYRNTEEGIMRSLAATSYGPVGIWQGERIIDNAPFIYQYPPLNLSLYRNNPVPGRGFPQGSLDLGIRLDIPYDTKNLAIELIPSPDRETGKPNSPGVELQFTNPGFIDKVRKEGFILPAPKLGEGPYITLPGMSYTWRVRISNNPNLNFYDREGWKTIQISPIWKIEIPEKEIKDASTPRGSEKISFLLDGKTTNNLTPSLQWQDGNTDVFYYHLQVSADPTFEKDPAKATAAVWENLIHGGVTNPLNSWKVPAGLLQPGKTYYMRIKPRVQGDGIDPEWGTTRSFITSQDARMLTQGELEVITDAAKEIVLQQQVDQGVHPVILSADWSDQITSQVLAKMEHDESAFIEEYSDPVYGVKPDANWGNGVIGPSAEQMLDHGNVKEAAILNHKGKVAGWQAYLREEDLQTAA